MSRIISIKRRNIINEKLYNLAVKEDESYIAQGIVVHNCRSLTIPIFEGDKYKLDKRLAVQQPVEFGGQPS